MTPDLLAELFLGITRFHDFTIQHHGGLPGFRDIGALHFAVARPWMTAWGEPIFKTPFEKASALAESIVRQHPFNDGNHRSALFSAYLVLGLHDLRPIAAQAEQRTQILKLGTSVNSLQEFALWLQQVSVRRSEIPS